MTRVAVLGGGVGGLSAAHELVERGFEVAVYEQKPVWGGKARSYGKPGSGAGGRKDLPAEHGFRLFPSFYRHLGDTVKRIPYAGNPNGVFDNLVTACRTALAFDCRPPVFAEVHFPKTLDEWFTTLHFPFLAADFGIPRAEAELFLRKLLVVLTSCQERRLAEYEGCPWWDFIEADGKSEAYQKLLGDGLIRKLVAMQGRLASARTMGSVGIQLLQDLVRKGQTSDRVLNGPTNEVWIDPWVRHLQQQGVELHLNASLQRLNYDGQRITSSTIDFDGRCRDVVADYYVCAVPVEVMCRVGQNLIEGAPSLAHLDRLHTEWMTGIQFYLRRDVPVVRGHVVYADSPWALTSISQHQFWSAVDLAQYGDGQVRGILSIDISDWHTPGDKVVRKPAAQCTAAEIQAEVWAQMKAHLDEGGQRQLEDADLLDWSLDPAIQFPCSRAENERNLEPLLINTAGSWQYRPEADLSNGVYREIPNLFLAADYVRTHTDLATMEGANEAARRAVNGILKAAGSGAGRCGVWPLEEPAIFAPLRAYDYTRFKLGYPHSLPDRDAFRRYAPQVSSLARRTTDLLKPHQYRFHTCWHVDAPVEEVWKLIAEPCTYPQWWRQYPKVQRLNDLQGVGARWEVWMHSSLPYQLRCSMEMTRFEAPHTAEWRVRGDLVGRDSWVLEPTPSGTRLTSSSEVSAGKMLLTLLAPAARRLLEWNHEIMMRGGEQQLRAELARRSLRKAPNGPTQSNLPLVAPGLGRSLRGYSSLVTLKAVGEDTGGVYSLLEVEDAPQGGPPINLFDHAEGAAYILEGKYTFLVGDRTFTATAGSFLLMPRRTWHNWKNVGAKPGRFLLFVTPGGMIEGFLEEADRVPPGVQDRVAISAIGQKYGIEFRTPSQWGSLPSSAAAMYGSLKRDLHLAPGEGLSFEALGSLITFKATAKDTGGAYSLFEVRDPPRAGQLPHVFYHVDGAAYVLEGEYVFQVGDRTFPAPPGSFVSMPKGVWHHWTNVGATPGRVLEIASPAGFEKLIEEVSQFPGGIPDRDRLLAITRKHGADIKLPPP